VFFLGDFNYRLNATTPEINALLAQHDFMELAKHDQLLSEKAKGQVFMDFKEGKLDFLPSFKYAKGTNTFGHLANTAERKRDPAWCDRILYRGEAQLLSYNLCPQLQQSDHKPVYADFLIQVSPP
jgi:endonuclease/exonuclease/phosphatase family metal-dependent hydrolase